MFSTVDFIILIVLVSLFILVGFVGKIEKWRTKWRERCDRKRKLAQRIDELDDAFDDLLDAVTAETNLAGAAGKANLSSAQAPYNAISVHDFSPTSTNGTLTMPLKTTTSAFSSNVSNNTSTSSFFMNAISLAIGFQTSTSIVGLPLEFYNYGARSYQFALCLLVSPIIIALFFVPFLYKIKSASIYDYLDDKFGTASKLVKKFTLLLSILFQFIFASLVLFSTSIACIQIASFPSTSSSLSLSQSSIKVEIWMISACLGALSAILALMGLKSVVLANFLQYLIMLACNIFIIFLGIWNFADFGSPSSLTSSQQMNSTSSQITSSSFFDNLKRLWDITKESGRGEIFVFEENFRTRYTFWNGLIGLLFNTLPSYSLTQQSYMRIKQAKSIRSARMLVLSMAPIGFLNLVLLLTLGLVMSAYLYRCGDLTNTSGTENSQVSHVNQIFTQFIAQFYSNYHGLFGLYIALLVSSAIGTVSSVLKALSVMLSQEFFVHKQPNASSLLSLYKNDLKSSSSPSQPIDVDTIAAGASAAATGTSMAVAGTTSELTTYQASFVRSHKLGAASRGATAMSSDLDDLYQEHLLSIEISKTPRKRKEKVLKKFLNKRKKGARYLSKKVVSILIVMCSMLIITISVGLSHVNGSLTSVAFSLMNALHGPTLFIYLCARFNAYSLRRHKYAIHRSTISKLRNFQFVACDVIASCLVAIALVEALFFARLFTLPKAEHFYYADRVTLVERISPFDHVDPVCPSQNWTTTTTTTTTTNGSIFTAYEQTKATSLPLNQTPDKVNFMYYFFAISFNWYPFLGFLVCCFTLALLNLSRLFFRILFQFFLAFKKTLNCC